MQCSKCGITVQVGDRFCEECGAPVIAIAKSKGGCEKCGAGSEEIDADGFCSNCGFRQYHRHNDRFEVICSPNLVGISDRGIKHHRNEDYVACAQIDNQNAYILVVCDGVSSSDLPELAAKTAAESACQALTATITNLFEQTKTAEEIIKAAIAEAMASVCAIPYNMTAETDPPSTTIVTAVVVDRSATIGWLGDSRAYWVSPNGSCQLTRDDSWLNDVVSMGEMSEAEAGKSPQAHAITKWIGADAVNMQPSIVSFNIPDSGYLLLCTDGFWNYIGEATQINTLVNLGADTLTVSQSLVEFALRSGGRDNISVAVLSF